MTEPSTEFAPPTRLSGEALLTQIASVTILREQFDLIPLPLCVLNRYRQILLANPPMRALLKIMDPEGLRIGEVLGCINADQHPAGCGCAKACAQCGNTNSMLVAINEHQADTREVRLTTTEGPLDLRAWATPIDVQDKEFTLFSIKDISDEKRRQVLEEVFFHDILNAAGALRGFAELAMDPEFPTHQDLLPHIFELSKQIVEQLKAQRDLLAAERGELRVSLQELHVQELLAMVRDCHMPLANRKGVRLAPPEAEDVIISTDQTLMIRILGNLYQNAIEASHSGDTVSIRFHNNCFEVHNPAVLPEAVKPQIFQRSFTTKGKPGHGIGTYSVKLLTEKFLQGRVDFTSQAPEGTVFRIHLSPES